jgi:hypothetical protein
MSDNNNNVFDLVILFLVFAMFGNNGFGIGGNANNSATTANMTADMITARETNSKVSANGMKLDAIAGIVSQNSANIESVKTAVYQGFTGAQKDMCELAYTLGGLIRDNKDATKDTYCQLSRQGERETSAVIERINQLENKIETIEWQKVKDENQTLKGQLSQNSQTAALKAYVDDILRGCCKPACSPCGTSCCDQLASVLSSISTQLVNLQTSVNKIPTT